MSRSILSQSLSNDFSQMPIIWRSLWQMLGHRQSVFTVSSVYMDNQSCVKLWGNKSTFDIELRRSFWSQLGFSSASISNGPNKKKDYKKTSVWILLFGPLLVESKILITTLHGKAMNDNVSLPKLPVLIKSNFLGTQYMCCCKIHSQKLNTLLNVVT